MLDRIINIKTELNYKSSGQSGSPGRQKGFFTGKVSANDSISFSPAVHYLSRINWRLKDISYNGKDKIKLIFYVAEFEFNAEIDLLRFYSENRQFFDIVKDLSGSAANQKVILTVSVTKQDYQLRDDIQVMELNGLRTLFKRITFLEIKNEINKHDSIALKNLMDEISFNIIKEFEYINTAFFTLVEKLVPGNNLQGHKFEDLNEPVIIEKIKVLTNND